MTERESAGVEEGGCGEKAGSPQDPVGLSCIRLASHDVQSKQRLSTSGEMCVTQVVGV